MNHLQKARLAIAIKSASQRAAHFPGWNAKKTLQEVVSIITDVQQVSREMVCGSPTVLIARAASLIGFYEAPQHAPDWYADCGVP